MNKNELLSKIKKLHQLYKEGKIKTLAQHEVNPGLDKSSRENYLYFTLPPCLNFQRSSPSMWASALKTWEDPETNYLFSPEKVVKSTRGKVQQDLLKYKLSLQKNKHTDIWMAVCRGLCDGFEGDPRKLFEKAGWDVVRVLEIVQKERRKQFPYLSGPKMANYWLYILTRYTDARFTNMQEISIIPDTHVLQCTVRLGLADRLVSPIDAADLWKDLLKNSEIAPVDMHPVLWNWSRNNFQPEV